MTWEIQRLAGTSTTVYKSIMNSVVILMHTFIKSVHSDAIDSLIIQAQSRIDLGDSTWENIRQCLKPKEKILLLFTAIESLTILQEEAGKTFLEVLINFEGIPTLAEAIRSNIKTEFQNEVKLVLRYCEEGGTSADESLYFDTTLELVNTPFVEEKDVTRKIRKSRWRKILSQGRFRRVTRTGLIFSSTIFSTILFLQIVTLTVVKVNHISDSCYDLNTYSANSKETQSGFFTDVIIISIDVKPKVSEQTVIPFPTLTKIRDKNKSRIFRITVNSHEAFERVLISYPNSVFHLYIKYSVNWPFAQRNADVSKVEKIYFAGNIGIRDIQVLLNHFNNVSYIVLNNRAGSLCTATPTNYLNKILNETTVLNNVKSIIFRNLTYDCHQLYKEWYSWMLTPHLQGIAVKGGRLNDHWMGEILNKNSKTLTHLKICDIDLGKYLQFFYYDLTPILPNVKDLQLDDLHSNALHQFCDLFPQLRILTSDTGYIFEEQLLYLGRCKKLSKINFAIKLTKSTSFDVTDFLMLSSSLVEVNITLMHDICYADNFPEEEKIVEIAHLETLPSTLVNFSVYSKCYILATGSNPDREESYSGPWNPHYFNYNMKTSRVDQPEEETCKISYYDSHTAWITSFLALWFIVLVVFIRFK